ncbi:unnamed protein product [Rotaria sordida]|uniref:F-box domain-containing protein n=1 Tax=Rotaria sordida TaxID=392033 RepID=A0A815ARK8_9BILA|nr:unnamed protein product [Rotaria sordida]CAF1259741.1 unnamed protein product [Rotaria sordida]
MISSSDNRLLFILDLLPKEIIFTIFDFLWAHDILYSFLNISNYFNNILLTYQNYHVNFKSILKQQFDLVCRFIQPNQITSLVLSDSNETPSQSKTFLSLFPIEKFINLRAITLSDIENDCHSLFFNIRQLKYLNYFETDTLSHLWMIETISRLKQLIINKYADNDYNHESLLHSISFSHLRNLTLPYCSYVQLRQILSCASKLTSLNISLIISDCTGIDYFAEQHQETPLIVNHLTMSIQTFTWYVEYNTDDFILYTIPRFVPRTTKHSLLSILPHSTTLPVEQYSIYYDQINELELDSNDKSSYRYTNVQRLILSITKINENIIDLSKVEYLCVKSLSWPLKKLFQIIKTSMTSLYHLKIDFSFSMIQLSDNIYPLEQIRIIDLPQFSCSFKNDNIDLSSLFPCIERLTIGINSLHQMTDIIDRFMHLSSGSFHIMNDHTDINYILTETDTIYKWLIEKTNRLARNRSFTYRLDSRSDIWIHLWISSESTTPEKVLNKMLSGEQLMELRETNGQHNCSRCCSLQ